MKTVDQLRPGRRMAALVAAVLAVGLVLSAGGPAAATGPAYVPYYTVVAGPEDLSGIAARFLGAGDRAVEIFNLNVGRRQADGSSLTSGDHLKAGWSLVLPWDAAGEGVHYGELPAKPATAPRKTKTTTRKTTVTYGDSCAKVTRAGAQPDWARAKLDAGKAWASSRGAGELVAVIDSGTDRTVAQLTGHVSQGTDVVSGTGRGDADCRGTGTAMAAIVVARPGKDGALAGIAPDATVMPVRVVTTGTSVPAADAATAIAAAVAAGATVIAIGSYVDTGDPLVSRAIQDAVGHDVVVVMAAPLGSAPVDPASALVPAGVLRVGGVDEAGRPARAYRSGTVDVLAPGEKVRSLGITGTGEVLVSGDRYAVAFAAGQAALVRSAYPGLPAAAVVDHIRRTAASPGGGAGLLAPAAALAAAITVDGRLAAPPETEPRSVLPQLLLLALLGLVLLGALIALIVRIRRLLRAGATTHPEKK
ncbi:S8 family serine peptidase [Actinoplanes sp. NPDC051494]|uniref:S8 family serine peptidase n=1 Tax=Actinoplanes sp. NPDC051494 TaxID=3363907 RepID=UPI003798A2CB